MPLTNSRPISWSNLYKRHFQKIQYFGQIRLLLMRGQYRITSLDPVWNQFWNYQKWDHLIWSWDQTLIYLGSSTYYIEVWVFLTRIVFPTVNLWLSTGYTWSQKVKFKVQWPSCWLLIIRFIQILLFNLFSVSALQVQWQKTTKKTTYGATLPIPCSLTPKNDVFLSVLKQKQRWF